jgi:hypothetical protein
VLQGGRGANIHGYGVAAPASEGMRRADMIQLYAQPQEQASLSQPPAVTCCCCCWCVAAPLPVPTIS